MTTKGGSLGADLSLMTPGTIVIDILQTIEPNFHDGILIPQQNNSPVSNGGNGGEIAAVVIVVLLLAALLGILAYRKLPM